MSTEKFIKIKDREIPINIRSYKTSKTIKIFFKGNVLNITKPKKLSIKTALQVIYENEREVYEKYLKIVSSEISTIKQWKTGEKIHYKGIELDVVREYIESNKINVKIEENSKKLRIILPQNINEEDIKLNVDKAIKSIFKYHTEEILAIKLPYWSKITGEEYNQFKVRDAISRYGSCMPSKKNLYFSSRLIMLPEEMIDAIIVHELCHIKHKNHGKEFYELVEQFITNYKEIDKWLKNNGKIIMF